jgi:hypothetical protein
VGRKRGENIRPAISWYTMQHGVRRDAKDNNFGFFRGGSDEEGIRTKRTAPGLPYLNVYPTSKKRRRRQNKPGEVG